MSYTNNLTLYAQVYGSGIYSCSTYENGAASATCANATGTTGATTNSGGILTNTGFDLLLAATIAVTLIFATLIVRFWKRPKKLSTGV